MALLTPPELFFEWLHWFAYLAFAVGSSSVWFALVGPIAMFIFLRFLTGVPYAEMSSLKSRGEAYRRYQSSTNAFFPWISKQDSLTRNSQLLASEFKPPKLFSQILRGRKAKFDQVSPLGGNSRVLPVCAKGVPWKRLRPLERFFAWTLRNLHGGTLQITFPSGVRALVGDRSFPYAPA